VQWQALVSSMATLQILLPVLVCILFFCYVSYLKVPWIVIVPAPWLSGLDFKH